MEKISKSFIKIGDTHKHTPKLTDNASDNVNI